MPMRRAITVALLFYGTYATFMIVSVLGWIHFHLDIFVTLLLVGIFYYHLLSPFIESILIVDPPVSSILSPPQQH